MSRVIGKLSALILSGAILMAAAESNRALTLEVDEQSDRVAIDLVATSPVVQRVEYTIELTGASRSRHTGSTTLPAHERRLLSRMAAGTGGGWCAKVAVREETGAVYNLTAGTCSES